MSLWLSKKFLGDYIINTYQVCRFSDKTGFAAQELDVPVHVDVVLLLLLHSLVYLLVAPREVGERRLQPLDRLHDVVGAHALPVGRAVEVLFRLLDLEREDSAFLGNSNRSDKSFSINIYLSPVEQHLALEVAHQPGKVLEGGDVLVLHGRRRVPRPLRHLHVQQFLRRRHLQNFRVAICQFSPFFCFVPSASPAAPCSWRGRGPGP